MKKLFKNKRVLIGVVASMFIMAIGVTAYSANAAMASEPSFDVSMSVNPNPVVVGNTVTVNGKITPHPFELQDLPKEIVLVLDTSGSMGDKIDADCTNVPVGTRCIEHDNKRKHKDTKMNALKNAAYKFIDKMEKVPNLNIGIVSFSSGASIKNINGSKLIEASNVDGLKSIVRSLEAGGGTNTGEGLRRAAYLLTNSSDTNPKANKTVILMSDGIPTYYTRTDYNNNYYMDIGQESGGRSYNSGDGSDDTYDLRDLGYAKSVADIIKNKGYNGFSIGYGLDSTGEGRITQIHNSLSNDVTNLFLTSDGAIDSVFNKIADKILDSYPVTNIQFDTKISTDFEIEYEGNKIPIPDITYIKEMDTNIYRAEPVEFTFQMKCNKVGEVDIFNGSKIEYMFNNKPGFITVEPIKVVVGEDKNIPITIQVSDSSGDINDRYNTKDQSPAGIEYNKEILNGVTNQEYRLFGSAKANIKLDTTKETIDLLQYQFVNTTENIDSINIDEAAWKNIDLTMDTINEDVDVENQGNLTQREYNVSDLPALSDDKVWSDRNKVFGTPLDGIYTKSTRVATTPNEYGEWIDYINNGVVKKRWRTKTLFMNQMTIASVNGNDYKEASKFWGYYSPEKTGWYQFALTSDDGSAGWLTVGGKTIEIANSFKPQGSITTTSGKKIYLEAGKYYPLHLEYFNWGGGAEFRMQYKFVSGEAGKEPTYGWQSYWTNIDGTTLYPSKSNEPGESATNVFNGAKGVAFPEEAGRYYIAYKCGNNGVILKSGIYGPFNINEKINVERSISINEAIVSEEFEFKYSIIPTEINVNDIYKSGSASPQENIYIKNFTITDVIPSGLDIKEVASNEVIFAQNEDVVTKDKNIKIELKQPIIYNLNRERNVYEADRIDVALKVSGKMPGTYTLQDINCFYNYNDITLKLEEASTIYFQGKGKENLTINVIGGSKILNHGIYLGDSENLLKSSEGSSSIKISNDMKLNIGVVVEVNHKDTKVRIISDREDINMQNINVKMYRLSDENILSEVSNDLFEVTESYINFKQGSEGKYIFIYEYEPKGNQYNTIEMTAEIIGYDSSKNLKLIIGENGIPNLF